MVTTGALVSTSKSTVSVVVRPNSSVAPTYRIHVTSPIGVALVVSVVALAASPVT